MYRIKKNYKNNNAIYHEKGGNQYYKYRNYIRIINLIFFWYRNSNK